MLIKRAILDRIASGVVTLAFRRWRRPTVRSGGQLRTAIGLLAIDTVEPIGPAEITERDAALAGYDNRPALLKTLPAVDGGTLYRIALRPVGPDPRLALRQQAKLSDGEWSDLSDRLTRLDRHSPHGAWTCAVLDLIDHNEGVRAGDLAARLGRPRLAFKADVRKLKALGLTESLDVGYRLSARGRAVLTRLAHRA
ncbi:hypothetical protein [Reyranella sp. CPCC 100927]|uniref:hypothetical protein n=1 Tax=Reyranella sp. CPCC 100927 TaxID=2599616 RepID=UPI0011B6473E|nr:hypothetical protein [Reyranella sp. CPCC 100927]TWT02068.1 hypothetical protein FQU96_31300 [Reyranella sp. CPCC 100927]